MRRKARIDATHREIVAGLRAAGCSVQPLTPGGKDDAGLPDLLVGRNRIAYLLEVKSGKQRLQEAQSKWHARWRGPPVIVVRSLDEALVAVGALREVVTLLATPLEPAQ